MIPWEMWVTMLALGILSLGYNWYVEDDENYTDILTGFASMIFFMICGISLFGGIITQTMTYANQYFAWLFIAIGIIEGIILFTRITDLWHTDKTE
ncbi:hypothetical protein [uncultured Methanolobus sp.]|uniref:hypothetical protein n=1 Tax=uncultured Methanolobus sp. TaxID=218300 RepID=UPI0029C8C09B|nr:hypothetical protein [uncultured Methanolobus sp.]